MSKTPIFKLPKIKHNSVKERKDFILDLVFISTGLAVLSVSVNESFKEGVKTIHKNKYRRNLAKIKEVHDYLKDKQAFILSMCEQKDILAMQHKIHDKTALPFISHISMTDKDVSLEYIAISVFEQGLLRKRKTKLNELLKPFCDYKLLYREIGANVEKSGIDFVNEWELVSNFVNDVKY